MPVTALPWSRVKLLAGRRTVAARLKLRSLWTLTLVAVTAGAKGGGKLTVTLKGRRATLGALSLQQ